MADLRLALSLAEACEAIGIGQTLLRQEIKAGRIRPAKIGDRLLFPVSMLQAYLEERMAASPEAQ